MKTYCAGFPLTYSCCVVSDTRVTEPAVSHERCRSSGSFIIQSLESFEGVGHAAVLPWFETARVIRLFSLASSKICDFELNYNQEQFETTSNH